MPRAWTHDKHAGPYSFTLSYHSHNTKPHAFLHPFFLPPAWSPRFSTFLVAHPGWGHLWFCQALFCLLTTQICLLSSFLPICTCPWSHIFTSWSSHLVTGLPPDLVTGLPPDLVTGLPPSSSNTVILSVVDQFSKMAWAKVLSQLILYHIFHLHAIPMDTVSDWEPHFAVAFCKEFCNQLGETLLAFHPYSFGPTECKNQEMETALRFLVSQNPSWWKQLLCVEYAHNSLSSSLSGLSTFQCDYGYQA